MRALGSVVLEALLVTIAAAGIGLLANWVSPKGLSLARNYFPGSGVNVPKAAESNTVADPVTLAAQRLQQRGLQIATSNEVIQFFRDERHQQGLIVFVDARDDQHYQAGHIPGAWQFNHYRAEQYMPSVLPVCLTAQKVIVYCSGGACEDSEFAAVMLRDAGVPGENLMVFIGGMNEWRTNNWPIEIGSRQSGQIAP